MALSVNYVWLAVVCSCMFVHIDGYCIFGFCNDPTMIAFEPDVASSIFMFTISCIIADFPLYPKSFKQPNYMALCCFEIMSALLLTNVVLMLCWIPFIRILANVFAFLYRIVEKCDTCPTLYWLHLLKLKSLLDSERALNITAVLAALGFYVGYLYVTDGFFEFSLYMKRLKENSKFCDWCLEKRPKKVLRKEISFNEEVAAFNPGERLLPEEKKKSGRNG